MLHVGMTRARVQTVLLADSDAPSEFLEEVSGTRSAMHDRRRPDPRPPGSGERQSHGPPLDVSDRRRREGVWDCQSAQVEALAGLHIVGVEPKVRSWRSAIPAWWCRSAISERGSPSAPEVTVEGKVVTLVPARGAQPARGRAAAGLAILRLLRGEDAGLSRALGQGPLCHCRRSSSDPDGTCRVSRDRSDETGALGRRDSGRPGLISSALIGLLPFFFFFFFFFFFKKNNYRPPSGQRRLLWQFGARLLAHHVVGIPIGPVGIGLSAHARTPLGPP